MSKPNFHWWPSMLRGLAASSAVVYVVWQVVWLAQGRLPPALFLAMTGLPAPTTGGARAFGCLLRGDWCGSLQHNAFAVPVAALVVLSAAWPCVQLARGHRAVLPRGAGLAWVALLLAAWAVKLAQSLA